MNKYYQSIIKATTLLIALLVLTGIAGYAANPPICPHVIGWNSDHNAFASGAPWVKVILWSDVEKAKLIGAKVFYRPYEVPGNDDRQCTNGVQHGNDVLVLLNRIPHDKWPDAIGYMNEFNADNTNTPAQFPAYYDTLRAGGYTGTIVYGSYGVGWPSDNAWALPVVQAAVAKADAVETHEYFDLTCMYSPYNYALRHVRHIQENPYLLGKPWFIGEMGTTLLCTEDTCCRNGWKAVGTGSCAYQKFTAQQYIDQLTIYRAGCANQIVACFLFQQGDGNFADKDVVGTPVADWMRTTWTASNVGTLTGNVKTSGGSNLSGATVTTNTGGYTATTDTSGNYTISNVTAGTYNVTAAKSGYTSQVQSGKTVTANQTTTCSFTLSPVTPGTITGNVKNTSAQNISGATVSTNTGGYTTTTDASGNYTLSNVNPATYTVTASKSGYASANQNATVTSGQTTTTNFTLSTQPFSGISNKNFEGGFFNDPDTDHQSGNSWHRFSVSGSSKSGSNYAEYHSSHWSQQIYDMSWVAGIYQQATGCTVGTNYTASVWVKGTDANVKFWVGIDPTGGTDAASANVQWSAQYGPGTTWTQISKQVAASSSTITMFIKAQNPYANVKYAYIDDADLVAGGGAQVGTISGNVKATGGANLSGATVSTNTGGYTTTTDASGNYTLSNVTTGTYDVTASKSGYVSNTQTGKTVTANATTTVNFTLTPTGTTIASEDFTTIPTWSSTFDAAWGSAATFSSVTGGQSGNFMQASRTTQGSSSRVKVYTVPANTNITVSIYMKCPSYANSYWQECACKLGNYSATDFDGNSGTWTYIKKFSNTGTNGNGNVWTQYSVSLNTGSSTQISVGYKHGSSGYTGPTVGWDTFVIN